MAQYAYETVREGYQKLWEVMTVTKVAQATAQAKTIIANRKRYEEVQSDTGVPWFVVGCLHMRESNANFNTWLHNGDPMRDKKGRPIKTVNVPKGRPPNPAISWREGAYDALVICEQLDKIKDWGPERVAYAMEKFNGFGYRNPAHDIPSPYLWGGTSVQKPGKYIRDGVYDANTIDPQIGGMAVLRALMALDANIRFANVTPSKPEVEAPPVPASEVPLSPAAVDTVDTNLVAPATRSKTVWGGVLTWLGGVSGSVFGMFQYLNNPYTLAALLVILVFISVGLYLVIKGRLDLKNLVHHLSEDNA